ncbi:MAG TPA: MauE/DoxX family redox-associated membrane protein [Chloroflexota bacterium]
MTERHATLMVANTRDLTAIGLLVARILCGGIFLVAALPKIQSPGHFADAVRAFHLLPPSLVMPFAFVVPWLELLVAVYLLAGFMTRVGAIGAIVLLGAFVAALLDALMTGNTAHACGCFGSGVDANPILTFLAGGNTITAWDVIRDVILMGLSGLIFWFGPGAISVEELMARRHDEAWEDRAS